MKTTANNAPPPVGVGWQALFLTQFSTRIQRGKALDALLEQDAEVIAGLSRLCAAFNFQLFAVLSHLYRFGDKTLEPGEWDRLELAAAHICLDWCHCGKCGQ